MPIKNAGKRSLEEHRITTLMSTPSIFRRNRKENVKGYLQRDPSLFLEMPIKIREKVTHKA